MLHSGMVLAAPQSGSGKTTITCALLAAMKNRKFAVRAFKSGPDYIDPMFHRQVIGVPSRNLDTFFSGADQIRELYGYDRENFTYSVIEGAMGLYDGLGGTQKEGSAYHLAQTLDLPVVLVLDARGMGRTMVALLAGILQYDRDHRIIGVILNRTSEGFCRTMTPVIEKELGLPVLGCFPVQKNLHLESRHLGLKMPQEMEGLRKQVNQAAEKLEETADLDRMLQLLRYRFHALHKHAATVPSSHNWHLPHVRFHAPSKSMGNLPPLPSATPTVLLPHPHNPAVLPKAHRQLQSARKHRHIFSPLP